MQALAKAESGQAQVQLQVAELRNLDRIKYVQQVIEKTEASGS